MLLLQLPLNSATLVKPETKIALMFEPKQHGDVMKTYHVLAVGFAILETTIDDLLLLKPPSPDSQLAPEETTLRG
ncbi:hypothetical protein BFC18_00095 [Alteromonas confluentis]|uniref:Uncharacterized protein n=1 Tax=Alteromonas confluentis TaxID=1656094 RepID=A0A1E7ZGV9_9ALTE|nr:hypothetical protein BFC18_00095 [Alteromonas confluentis]